MKPIDDIQILINLCWGIIIALYFSCAGIFYLTYATIGNQNEKQPILVCGNARPSPLPHNPKFDNGLTLFENNCSPCHEIQNILVGPSLKGIFSRHNRHWLIKWIENPQRMVNQHDPYALKITKEYKHAGIMLGFPNLNKVEINEILDYLEQFE